MTALRAVIDTNVAVSALVFDQRAVAWIRHAWQSGQIKPLISKPTVEELLRVFAYPKLRLTAVEQDDLLADYLPFCESVIVPRLAPKIPKCCDPADVPFLELALAGRADALVTGDRDLLSLADRFSVPILTPAALHAQITRS